MVAFCDLEKSSSLEVAFCDFKISSSLEVANCDFKFASSLSKVANCDLETSASSFVSWNMKSSGKRSILRLTCSFSRLVSTPYRRAKSRSRMTCLPRTVFFLECARFFYNIYLCIRIFCSTFAVAKVLNTKIDREVDRSQKQPDEKLYSGLF